MFLKIIKNKKKMRQLVNVTNVDAPDADYPRGRVRDKVGATLGTEYSEILHGDVIQFFQKLVIDSGITENDLPDNVTNGYQLLEALGIVVGSWKSYTILDGDMTANTGTFSTGTGSKIFKYSKIGKKVTLDLELIDANAGVSSTAQFNIVIPSEIGTVVGKALSTGIFVNSDDPTEAAGTPKGSLVTKLSVDSSVDNTLKITPSLSALDNFYNSGANNLTFRGQITFEVA
jgi:hypothetical protein